MFRRTTQQTGLNDAGRLVALDRSAEARLDVLAERDAPKKATG